MHTRDSIKPLVIDLMRKYMLLATNAYKTKQFMFQSHLEKSAPDYLGGDYFDLVDDREMTYKTKSGARTSKAIEALINGQKLFMTCQSAINFMLYATILDMLKTCHGAEKGAQFFDQLFPQVVIRDRDILSGSGIVTPLFCCIDSDINVDLHPLLYFLRLSDKALQKVFHKPDKHFREIEPGEITYFENNPAYVHLVATGYHRRVAVLCTQRHENNIRYMAFGIESGEVTEPHIVKHLSKEYLAVVADIFKLFKVTVTEIPGYNPLYLRQVDYDVMYRLAVQPEKEIAAFNQFNADEKELVSLIRDSWKSRQGKAVNSEEISLSIQTTIRSAQQFIESNKPLAIQYYLNAIITCILANALLKLESLYFINHIIPICIDMISLYGQTGNLSQAIRYTRFCRELMIAKDAPPEILFQITSDLNQIEGMYHGLPVSEQAAPTATMRRSPA